MMKATAPLLALAVALAGCNPSPSGESNDAEETTSEEGESSETSDAGTTTGDPVCPEDPLAPIVEASCPAMGLEARVTCWDAVDADCVFGGWDVDVGDIDGDELDDVLISTQPTQIRLTTSPDKALEVEEPIEVEAPPVGWGLADLDGDGHLDIYNKLGVAFYGSLYWGMQGEPSDTLDVGWGPAQISGDAVVFEEWSSFGVSDLNLMVTPHRVDREGGREALVAVKRDVLGAGAEVVVFDLAGRELSQTSAQTEGGVVAGTGDFNGDGIDDLAMYGYLSPPGEFSGLYVWLLSGDAVGMFSSGVPAPYDVGSDRVAHTEPMDADGDGVLELAVAFQAQSQGDIPPTSPGGTVMLRFTEQDTFEEIGVPMDAENGFLAPVDFDGDGREELVTTNSWSGNPNDPSSVKPQTLTRLVFDAAGALTSLQDIVQRPDLAYLGPLERVRREGPGETYAITRISCEINFQPTCN